MVWHPFQPILWGVNFVCLDLNNASKFQTIIKCDIISEKKKERNFEETN